MQGLDRQENIRTTQAARKIKQKYKARRQALRQLRKNKKKQMNKDKAYIAGAFSKTSAPDIDFICHKEVLITFVDGSEVKDKITLLQ